MEKPANAKKETWKKILTGLIAGLLNGLFGGGGGMAVVPCLTFICGYPVKKAHATAILIILPLSILSGAIYFTFGKFDLKISLLVSAGVTAVVGALFLKKLKNKAVTVIFSVVMAAAGVKMLFF